jgi:hypothetical protein
MQWLLLLTGTVLRLAVSLEIVMFPLTSIGPRNSSLLVEVCSQSTYSTTCSLYTPKCSLCQFLSNTYRQESYLVLVLNKIKNDRKQYNIAHYRKGLLAGKTYTVNDYLLIIYCVLFFVFRVLCSVTVFLMRIVEPLYLYCACSLFLYCATLTEVFPCFFLSFKANARV